MAIFLWLSLYSLLNKSCGAIFLIGKDSIKVYKTVNNIKNVPANTKYNVFIDWPKRNIPIEFSAADSNSLTPFLDKAKPIMMDNKQVGIMVIIVWYIISLLV